LPTADPRLAEELEQREPRRVATELRGDPWHLERGVVVVDEDDRLGRDLPHAVDDLAQVVAVVEPLPRVLHVHHCRLGAEAVVELPLVVEVPGEAGHEGVADRGHSRAGHEHGILGPEELGEDAFHLGRGS
jgi:hypothetical protein